MAGLDDVTKKAHDLMNDGKEKASAAFEDGKSKVDETVNSDKFEEVSDGILGGLAGAANKITGGKFADKIDEMRDSADKKIGKE